jgi:hypothetical protein
MNIIYFWNIAIIYLLYLVNYFYFNLNIEDSPQQATGNLRPYGIASIYNSLANSVASSEECARFFGSIATPQEIIP